MSVYSIDVSVTVYLTVEVEADSRLEAEAEALEAATMGQYAGNGGFDKLCGVEDSRASITDIDEPVITG